MQRLRLDFDTRFSKMRRQVNQQPGFFGLRPLVDPIHPNKAADYKTLAIHLLKRHADDFWVHPTDEHRQFKAFFFCWTKYDYLRKKPFFQLPLVRDRFNIPYRESRKNPDGTAIFEDLEEYLFMPRREYGSTPLPKYAKAVPNSMICYDKSWDIELLLSGGLAFNHLFSKIDCYRMQVTLYRHLARTRNSILWLKKIRRRFDLTKKEAKSLKLAIKKMAKTARRMKLYRTFWRTGSRPEWMFISILPILPPDLRPIIKMSNDQLAVSDLNRLYQTLFFRNRNLKATINEIYTSLGIDCLKLANDPIALATNYQTYRFSTSIISFQQNLLQNAVDALLDNGKSGTQPFCGSNDRPLKSLSDILKGKKGRFRQNLLGKRVDYSGRSVIVVGPKLKLYQCGLPKELALELFQSLLIRKMMQLKVVRSMIGAKQLIRRQHPIIWPLLNTIMDKSPIFLNRAPTLHRLGVQAFLPKLVRGKAILLHPLVCPAFNADFDGDQMGVHVPLSIEAKSESWALMLSSQNILSPATGDAILTPSQDMVLGCYYLTTFNAKFTLTQTTHLELSKQKENRYFSDLEDVYKAYTNKQLHAHDFIWLRWPKNYYSDQPGQKVLEVRIKRYKDKLEESMFIGESMFITSNSHKTFRIPQYIPQNVEDQPTTLVNVAGHKKDQFIRTTVGRVILNHEFQRQIYGSPTRYANYVQSY